MGGISAYLIPAVDGLAYGLLLSVLATGLSLCWGTGNVLNLAHGALYVTGAYATAMLSHGGWGGFLLALVVGTACGGVGGGVLAAATWPIRRRGALAAALLTFGIALVASDVMTDLFGHNQRPVSTPRALAGSLSVAGHRYPAYRLMFVGVAAVLATGAYLVLQRSRIGAVARAAVDDPQMLSMLGRNPAAVHAGVIVTAGLLAGLAGALGAPILGPGPGVADTVLLLCLTVVVLGGLGRIRGALVASIVVGEVQAIGPLAIPPVSPYLLFGAVALVLAWRYRTTAAGARA